MFPLCLGNANMLDAVRQSVGQSVSDRQIPSPDEANLHEQHGSIVVLNSCPFLSHRRHFSKTLFHIIS